MPVITYDSKVIGQIHKYFPAFPIVTFEMENTKVSNNIWGINNVYSNNIYFQ